MRMVADWTVSQLITDLYSTLSEATQREFEEHGDTIESVVQKPADLRAMWEHFHCTAFLVTSFAIVEGACGSRAWMKYEDLPQDEFEALYCIRNALVHNDGHLGRNTDQSCPETVGKVDLALRSDLSWTPVGRAKVDPYYRLDGDEVTLLASAFDRIYFLLRALCEREGVTALPQG